MNAYCKSSDYYPDDKDIFDFLSSTGASHPEMLNFLADCGIFCSAKNSKEDIQQYIAHQFLSWPMAVRLLSIVDTRDTEEHLTTSDLPITTDFDIVRASIEAVRQHRAKTHRENYELKFGTNEVEAVITYVHLDTSKTRVLQKRERQIDFLITILDDGLRIRHTNNNPVALAILHTFLGKLAEKTKADLEKLKPQYISFGKISSNKVRVQFFKDMMMNIPEFDMKDVTSVKVSKMPKVLSHQEGADGDDSDEDEEIEANEAVNKVIIYGRRLFSTKEFQNLVAKGFFISAATWQAEYSKEAPMQVEFTAGFNDAEFCKLGFRVSGKFSAVDGMVQKTREKLPASSAKVYMVNLESSIRKAFEVATAAQEAENQTKESEGVSAVSQAATA